jgi:peptide/nickel transport system ATP-binding protein/oligopeptide transport system ATP-binding protein
MENPLIELRNLKTHFRIRRGVIHDLIEKKSFVHAVDDVSFEIRRGETFGLVGESGCGKTTLGRTMIRLVEPTAGEFFFEGMSVFDMAPEALRTLRKELQIIFQDPYASLNPRKTVHHIVASPLRTHQIVDRTQVKEKVLDLLDKVGLQREHVDRYPHQFSGGQRQRIGIARALATSPRFIIADEPLSALDVSIQAQILNLLEKLKEEFHLTYLFISHDLNVVSYFSDRVAVMYLGQLVELGKADIIFKSPAHPYSKALISAILNARSDHSKKKIRLLGDISTPIDPPPGCRFFKRCYSKKGIICEDSNPMWVEIEPGHYVACHHFS